MTGPASNPKSETWGLFREPSPVPAPEPPQTIHGFPVVFVDHPPDGANAGDVEFLPFEYPDGPAAQEPTVGGKIGPCPRCGEPGPLLRRNLLFAGETVLCSTCMKDVLRFDVPEAFARSVESESDEPNESPDSLSRPDPIGWSSAIIVALIVTGGLVVGWELLRLAGLIQVP